MGPVRAREYFMGLRGKADIQGEKGKKVTCRDLKDGGRKSWIGRQK